MVIGPVSRMAMVALLVVAGGVGAALADTVTLQNGLNAYTGTHDSQFTQGSTAPYGFGLGGTSSLYVFDNNYDSQACLVQFDLPALNAASINSAKLRLYHYADAYGGTQFKIQQLGMSWAEGTATDYGSAVDGAGHRNRFAPVKLANADWVKTAGLSYSYTPASPLAANQVLPADALRRWVIKSTSYANYCRWHDVKTGPIDGSAYASLAALEGAAGPFDDGFGYYYDGPTNVLYMRTTGDSAPPQSIYTVDSNNTWDGTSRAAAGAFNATVTIANPALAQWVEWDVTQLVQRWMGLDGEPLMGNYGVQLDSANPGSGAGAQFYSREYAVDPTLRPMLVIDYAGPIAEPAALGLLLLGGLPLLRRWRSA